MLIRDTSLRVHPRIPFIAVHHHNYSPRLIWGKGGDRTSAGKGRTLEKPVFQLLHISSLGGSFAFFMVPLQHKSAFVVAVKAVPEASFFACGFVGGPGNGGEAGGVHHREGPAGQAGPDLFETDEPRRSRRQVRRGPPGPLVYLF